MDKKKYIDVLTEQAKSTADRRKWLSVTSATTL